MILVFVHCVAVGYSYEFTLTKGTEVYKVESNRTLYDIFKYHIGNDTPDSTNTERIDSLIVVQDRNDSIYVFINQGCFAFYCIKQEGKFILSYVQNLLYVFLWEFQYLDINKDGNLDLVAFYGAENEDFYDVLSIDYHSKEFSKIYHSDYYRFITDSEHSTINHAVKIRNHKLYMSYACFPMIYNLPDTPWGGQVLKYGVLDYTRDKTRELYFRPVSVITVKQWNKK